MKINRKHIISIVLLVLITILVILQIMWQKQAYAIEEKDFYIHTQNALSKVKTKLKNANSCVTFFSKPGFMPNEGMYILKQKWDSTGFYGKADTIPLLLNKDEIIKKNEIDFLYNNYKSSINTYAELTLNIIYNPADTVDNTDINESNFKEVIRSKNNILDIFDTAALNAFIKEKLKEENIEVPFGFGILDLQTNKVQLEHNITDTAKLLRSAFSTEIFRNDHFISPQRLVLVFESDKYAHFRFSPAFLSIFVIALLCMLIYSLYRFFQKQKKIADLKSEFIQNLNHEMNTPITNIQLAIDLMKKYIDPSANEVQKLYEIITSESDRLQQNIDRALQIGMIETNTLLLNKEPEDVNQLTKEICSVFRSKVEKEEGTIIFHSDGICKVLVDKMHFTNCISSILDNAIKYRGKERKLQIICSVSGDKDWVTISLEDNGKGMTKEVRNNIFEKFYREDAKLVHNTKGFGIGLSYVKAIIKMHSGEIAVKSEINKGSIFEIKLPLLQSS